jgi:S1-C subfamily serine protease
MKRKTESPAQDSLRMRCPKCGKAVAIKRRPLSNAVTCPSCHDLFVVPSSGGVITETGAQAPTAVRSAANGAVAPVVQVKATMRNPRACRLRWGPVLVIAGMMGGIALFLFLGAVIWLLAAKTSATTGETSSDGTPSTGSQLVRTIPPGPDLVSQRELANKPQPSSPSPAPMVRPPQLTPKESRNVTQKANPTPKKAPGTGTRTVKTVTNPEPSLDTLLTHIRPAIAYLDSEKASGTAFVVRPGVLATNVHVLEEEYIDNYRARFISAADPTAKGLPLKLLYHDRARDLALLAVESDQKPLPLSPPDEIRKGHRIAVVGHPSRFRGAIQELHAITQGTVEGLVMAERKPWYHLKADAFPGNSGGPVVDRRTGHVIGVLTFGLRDQEEGRGASRIRTDALGRTLKRDEPRDTFCIPVAFLRDAIAVVENAEDREKLSSGRDRPVRGRDGDAKG